MQPRNVQEIFMQETLPNETFKLNKERQSFTNKVSGVFGADFKFKKDQDATFYVADFIDKLAELRKQIDQIDDQIKNIEAGGKIPDEVIQTIRKDPKFKSVSQKPANDPDLREIEEVLLEYGEKHASGGIAGQLHLNEGGRASLSNGGLAHILGV